MKPLEKSIQDNIQKIANENNVAIIGFVAPQEAVRISPVTYASAAIDESDMYELEKRLEKYSAQKIRPIPCI